MLQYKRQVIGIPLEEVKLGDRLGVDGSYGTVTAWGGSDGRKTYIGVSLDSGVYLTIKDIDFDQPVRVWRRK